MTINSIPLSPVPYYDNPASEVGGGAVGLVPYHCHLPDCTPAGVKDDDDSNGIDDLEECEEGYHARVVIPVNEDNLDTVTVMHYGPIVQEGTGKPFTVRRKSLASPMCEWIDRTSDFTHTMHPGGNSRAMKIDGPFAYSHDWLIEPVRTGTDRLLCGETIAVDDVPVAEYDFRIQVLKPQDVLPNGILNPDDITAWLLDPQDTTLDGTTDNDDLVDVINAVAEYGE